MHKRKESDSQHWASLADLWENLGSPLRPGAEDQAGYQTFIDPWLKNFARPRILILGVTPEIFHLQWPQPHDLLALDRAREMIDEVWPGPPECAVQGDWLEMPLASNSREVALCDGGPLLLEYPQAHSGLVDELHRVLATGGRAIFRLFTPPAKHESVEEVLRDLLAGEIRNLNILKLRLGAALQPSTEAGVGAQDILRAVESVDSDLAQLAQRLGWSWDHMRVIEVYRGSPARYHFISETQFTHLFCHDGRFAPIGHWHGTYPLAERCPIVAYERQPSPA
ncbi:MAG: hypothetical protein ACXV97_05965 [Chthoniobacterales bacterium]